MGSLTDFRTITASTAVGIDDTDVFINLGPTHPSSHGALRIKLTVDGDRVQSAAPLIGHVHRGAEKLFEVRDYRQIMVLANRHDWLGAFASELGVALTVERLMGLPVPPRATWLRTALAEINRVTSHLAFLGSFPYDATSPLVATHGVREGILQAWEEFSGGRMHYMINRIGGLKEAPPPGWTARTRQALAQVRRLLPHLDAIINHDELVRAQTTGVGVLDRSDALRYGVSGPAARASGVDLDLRRDEPYLAYGELRVPVVTRTAGDCHARLACLLDQVSVSLDLAETCLDRADDLSGPVNVRLPKVVKPAEGHLYTWTENPLGVAGYYLVSRGDKTPWRLRLRTPSFANVQALSALLPGCRLDQLPAILASLTYVVGDLDK